VALSGEVFGAEASLENEVRADGLPAYSFHSVEDLLAVIEDPGHLFSFGGPPAQAE